MEHLFSFHKSQDNLIAGGHMSGKCRNNLFFQHLHRQIHQREWRLMNSVTFLALLFTLPNVQKDRFRHLSISHVLFWCQSCGYLRGAMDVNVVDGLDASCVHGVCLSPVHWGSGRSVFIIDDQATPITHDDLCVCVSLRPTEVLSNCASEYEFLCTSYFRLMALSIP